MECSYCHSEYHDSEYHPGTCANCGGAKGQSIEIQNYILEIDMYGDYILNDEFGRFVRMATEADRMLYGRKVPVVNNGKVIDTFVLTTY